MSKKLKKEFPFCQKNAKIRDIEILENISSHLENIQ